MRINVTRVAHAFLGIFLVSLLPSVQSCGCSSDAPCDNNTSTKATAEERSIEGRYSLVLVSGSAPPFQTGGGYTGTAAPFGQCFLVIESGFLTLNDDLTYELSRSNHYHCPAGNGKFVDTSPSFVVDAHGSWSYVTGNLTLSHISNTDFTINAAKVTQAGQISVDMSLVGCSPNPGFVCVPVSEIVMRYGK